jgi:hypothetical protein
MGRKTRTGIAAKIVGDVEREARRIEPPAAPVPLETLETIAARMIREDRAEPLPADEKQRMLDLDPDVERARRLRQLPSKFWRARVRVEYLLGRNKTLRPQTIAAADWQWFVGLTSRGPEADAGTWERWIRGWLTAVAHMAHDAHLLVAFIIARGETTRRRHAHFLVSFPPGCEPPDRHEAALGWRATSPRAGRIDIRDFDPDKNGILYMIRHRDLDSGARIGPRVGCPQIGSCRKRGCRVAPFPWRIGDDALAF